MSNAAQKTPISLLQELCAQFGMTPDYKLMSVEGAVHAPTFMYRVQVSEVVATATGQSKKKAKHAAAKAVLEKLLSEDGEYSKGFVSDGVTVNSETLNEVINSETAVVPIVDENTAGNPVGALQELCMKQRWQPPYYETDRATGLPHEKIFYIACYVDKFSEIGEGKSKRLAKRQAADNMLKRLRSLKIINDDDDEDVKETSSEDGLETSADSKPSKVENADSTVKISVEDVDTFLNIAKAFASTNVDTQCCDNDNPNIEATEANQDAKTENSDHANEIGKKDLDVLLNIAKTFASNMNNDSQNCGPNSSDDKSTEAVCEIGSVQDAGTENSDHIGENGLKDIDSLITIVKTFASRNNVDSQCCAENDDNNSEELATVEAIFKALTVKTEAIQKEEAIQIPEDIIEDADIAQDVVAVKSAEE